MKNLINKINNVNNIEVFNGLRINTDLLGLVLTAKYNGEHIPNRNWEINIKSTIKVNDKLSYPEWRKHINKVSKVYIDNI
jgi:hypothetical protein